MEITLNVNINAPALVEIIREAMAQTAGKPAPRPSAAVEKEVAANNAAALSSDAADLTDTPKRGGRSKKDAPAPVAAAPAAPAAGAEEGEFANPAGWSKDQKDQKLAIVRSRLSDYSADKRYGMDGVFAILKKYGVDRITALPTDRYAEFKAELDAALAKPSVDPLA